MNILPSVTARKCYTGRAVLHKAFEAYFKNNDHELGSVLVRAQFANSLEHHPRHRALRSWRSNSHINQHLPFCPLALLLHLSHPTVLADLRSVVAIITHISSNPSGLPLRSLEISRIKPTAPSSPPPSKKSYAPSRWEAQCGKSCMTPSSPTNTSQERQYHSNAKSGRAYRSRNLGS